MFSGDDFIINKNWDYEKPNLETLLENMKLIAVSEVIQAEVESR
jgi:hypothetical protein